MKDWLKRHPLWSYFFVAYAVSWSIAVPLALQRKQLLGIAQRAEQRVAVSSYWRSSAER